MSALLRLLTDVHDQVNDDFGIPLINFSQSIVVVHVITMMTLEGNLGLTGTYVWTYRLSKCSTVRQIENSAS